MGSLRDRLLAASLGLPILLAGCESIGAGSIQEGRLKYNEAVHDTGAEQLLTNIVRIQKNELPFSVLVTEIIAGVTPAASVGGSVTGLGIGKKGGAFRQGSITSGGLSIGASYAEGTSVQYQPVGGSALVTQLTTPVSVSLIGDLFDSGWPLLTVLEMTTGSLTPVQRSFGSVLNPMSELADKGWMDVVPTAASKAGGNAADVADNAAANPQTRRAAKPTGDTGRGATDQSWPAVAKLLSQSVEKIAAAMKPDKGADSITLYFALPRDDADRGRAAALWCTLVREYAGTQPGLSVEQVAHSIGQTGKPQSGDDISAEKCQAAIVAGVHDMDRIELRTKPLAQDAAATGVDWKGRIMTTLSAYGILKTAEISDYTPTEVIDVVPAEFYDRIQAEPWNRGKQFYTFLTSDICSPEYGGKTFDHGSHCQFLINPENAPEASVSGAGTTNEQEQVRSYEDQDAAINNAVDGQICRNLNRGDVTDRRASIPNACTVLLAKPGAQYPEKAVNYPPINDAIYTAECTQLELDDGECWDKQENLNHKRRLILVQFSPNMPTNPFKMIFRDGYYYYIGEKDYISQKNFALLALIEDVLTVAPSGPLTTTIPVGAP